jgi:hypothetical protein
MPKAMPPNLPIERAPSWLSRTRISPIWGRIAIWEGESARFSVNVHGTSHNRFADAKTF